MLLNDVITLMKSLLNKDLHDAIYLLKNININYAYDIAYEMINGIFDSESGTRRIIESKRHNKYKNSYIYLVVKNQGWLHNFISCEKVIVECKLYQVNKEETYVVTTLKKNYRDTLGLIDIHDIIVSL